MYYVVCSYFSSKGKAMKYIGPLVSRHQTREHWTSYRVFLLFHTFPYLHPSTMQLTSTSLITIAVSGDSIECVICPERKLCPCYIWWQTGRTLRPLPLGPYGITKDLGWAASSPATNLPILGFVLCKSFEAFYKGKRRSFYFGSHLRRVHIKRKAFLSYMR